MAVSGVTPVAGGCALAIKVTPRSSRITIEPPHYGRLRCRVTAVPAGGEANEAVLKLLSKALGVPKTSMQITYGSRGHEKTVFVRGVEAADMEQRLSMYFGKR
jgi:uncharacterized protein YggU (UPF0235/DUF167 family)